MRGYLLPILQMNLRLTSSALLKVTITYTLPTVDELPISSMLDFARNDSHQFIAIGQIMMETDLEGVAAGSESVLHSFLVDPP